MDPEARTPDERISGGNAPYHPRKADTGRAFFPQVAIEFFKYRQTNRLGVCLSMLTSETMAMSVT